MTKKRSRKNLSHSQDQVVLQIQNPKMIEEVEEEQSQPSPTLNQAEEQSQPSLTLIQEEEQELRDPDQGELEIHEDQQQEPQDEEQQNQEQDEQEGMDLSPSPPSSPPLASSIADLIPGNLPHVATNASRKATKRKKNIRHKKRAAALEKKLQVLKENLQPIPFVPEKTLDFSKHEKLFKRLGLWDFAHLEFDRNIRTDLLAPLIANFNPQSRCSFVNEFRIMVNRADLARALKLPVKKDKINPSEAPDPDSEVLSEESISFILDFVSNWILLHEDAWMMPDEVLTWIRFIKDGQLHKVDWPGLIWFMVEKELMQAPQLEQCYYASHLQCLMKFQREDLFKEQPKLEISISIKDEEDVVDVTMNDLDGSQEQELENQGIELCLGQGKIETETETEQVRDEDDVMDFQECKEDEEEEEEEEEEESGQWLSDGKNNVGHHFLQPCNLNEGVDLECQHESKQELEEEERYGLSSERLSSADFMQAMEAANIPCNAPVLLLDPSSGDFLASSADTHMNSSGPSMSGNAGKREISHEDDVHHHSLNDHHKRMRSHGTWDQKSSDFDLCMDQVQSWMAKARMMYEAKEQALANAQINDQFLYNEIEQRDSVIQHLERVKSEELQKRQVEIHLLDRELYVMSNLLDGYKKALKETRRAFAEYRERCQQPEEPLYKDAVGTGGFVLSTMELEKQLLEQAEEDRIKRSVIEEQIKNFELVWSDKFEIHRKEVQLLINKLSVSEKEVKLLKEVRGKRKIQKLEHAFSTLDKQDCA